MRPLVLIIVLFSSTVRLSHLYWIADWFESCIGSGRALIGWDGAPVRSGMDRPAGPHHDIDPDRTSIGQAQKTRAIGIALDWYYSFRWTGKHSLIERGSTCDRWLLADYACNPEPSP